MRELLQRCLDKFEHLWEIGIDAEYKVDLLPEIRALRNELAKPEMPTKLFGPNLEEILNAAGFYKRDAVCCGDYKKCIEPCTPKGEWLAKQELDKPERKYPDHETYCGRCGACTYKPWVGLSDDEIDWIFGLAYADDMELLKTIEAKLKEKNGG